MHRHNGVLRWVKAIWILFPFSIFDIFSPIGTWTLKHIYIGALENIAQCLSTLPCLASHLTEAEGSLARPPKSCFCPSLMDSDFSISPPPYFALSDS